MSERLPLQPHPCFAETASILAEQLARVAARIDAGNFASLLDPLLRDLLQRAVESTGADEGTVWLLDSAQEKLVPVYNTGPRAAEIVGRFQQPLRSGLISMVVSSEQPFLENDIPGNPAQSKLLDERLGLRTRAMIAVPFHFLKACRGVISCVQLQPAAGASSAPDRPGFTPDGLADCQRLAAVVGRLLEYQLVSRIIGWSVGPS